MSSQELSLHVSSSQSPLPLHMPHPTSIPAIPGNSLVGIFASHAPLKRETASELKIESKRINEICLRGMTLTALFRDIVVPFDKMAERRQLDKSMASLGILRQQCVEETFNTTLAYQKALNTAVSKYDFIVEDLTVQDLGVLKHPSFPKDFLELDSFKDHLKILSQKNPENPDLQQKVLFALSVVYQQKIAESIRNSENRPLQALQDNYERLSVLIHELAPLNIPHDVKQSDSVAEVLFNTAEALTKQVKQAPIDNLKKVQFFDHHFPSQDFKNVQKEVMIRLLDSEVELARSDTDKQKQGEMLRGIATKFLKLERPEDAEKISKLVLKKEIRAQVMVDVMRYFIEKGDKAGAQGAIPRIAHAGMREAAKCELRKTGL